MLGDKNKVTRKGLTEKVTFKQRPEGSDGAGRQLYGRRIFKPEEQHVQKL